MIFLLLKMTDLLEIIQIQQKKKKKLLMKDMDKVLTNVILMKMD